VTVGTPFGISAGPDDFISGYFVLNAHDLPLATGLLDATTMSVSSLTAIPGVPEPSTWVMMLLGFAGLGFAFRQSRQFKRADSFPLAANQLDRQGVAVMGDLASRAGCDPYHTAVT
jgi:hypothetical protein